MSHDTMTEFELNHLPSDGITRVRYIDQQYNQTNHNKNNNLLGVSSWDKSFRLYNAESNELLLRSNHESSVMDFCSNPFTQIIYTATLDGTVHQIDTNTQHKQHVTSHSSGVKCIEYLSSLNLLMSGSWDGTVQYHDARSNLPTHIHTYTHDKCKVYTMHCVDSVNNNKPRLVVGLNSRQVYIYDLRKLTQPEQIRESSLINQTRCIQCSPNGTMYVLSSIEGRVSVEYFDPSASVQSNKYAFKCHRQKDPTTGDTLVYPVNCVVFHPVYHTFATGGADGQINVWDGDHKKRICQYSPYSTSIASMSFNSSGDKMAVAVSYTYENGEQTNTPQDTVYIRNINTVEVQPKTK